MTHCGCFHSPYLADIPEALGLLPRAALGLDPSEISCQVGGGLLAAKAVQTAGKSTITMKWCVSAGWDKIFWAIEVWKARSKGSIMVGTKGQPSCDIPLDTPQ